MEEVNNELIRLQAEQIVILKSIIDNYKQALIEVDSQLGDRGGFDILRASINNLVK
tara:strand:+ start:258 stop:425 length:168 start_codon:yes stop_codon:yes gene_type:complete